MLSSVSPVSPVSPEKKPLVFKVMRHILSKEVMEKFHTALTSFAPITKDAEYKGIPKLADLHNTENNKVYFRKNDQIRGTAAANEVMQRNIQRIILGEVTVQEALGTIDKEARTVLSVNKK